jgi:capsular polysaccharide biosynthesis protein
VVLPAGFPRARTWLRLLAAGALLGALAGLGVALHLAGATVGSSSEIVLSVGPGIGGSSDAAATEDQYLGNRMATYAALGTSDRVLGPAARQLGTTAAAVRPDVTVAGDSSSTVLTVTARAPDPGTAAATTRAVDGSLVAAITAIETSPGAAPPIVASVVSPPTVPDPAVRPPLGPAAAAGAVAGLVVALLAALARATGLPQRATRAFLRWLFGTPPPPSRPRPAAPGPVWVPPQVTAESAPDGESTPTSAVATPG